jgi:hypothetical protein
MTRQEQIIAARLLRATQRAKRQFAFATAAFGVTGRNRLWTEAGNRLRTTSQTMDVLLAEVIRDEVVRVAIRGQFGKIARGIRASWHAKSL